MTTDVLSSVLSKDQKFIQGVDELMLPIRQFLHASDTEDYIETLGCMHTDFMGRTDIDAEFKANVAFNTHQIILLIYNIEKQYDALMAIQKEVANA